MTDWDFKQLAIGAAFGRGAERHASQQAQKEGHSDGYAAGIADAFEAIEWAGNAGFTFGGACVQQAFLAHLEEVFRRLAPTARAEFAKAYLDVQDSVSMASVNQLGSTLVHRQFGAITLDMPDAQRAEGVAEGSNSRFENLLHEVARGLHWVSGAPPATSPDGLASADRADLEKQLLETREELERVKRAAKDRERAIEADARAQCEAAEAEKETLRGRFLRTGQRIGAGDAAIWLLENLPRSAVLGIAESCLSHVDPEADLLDALAPRAREPQTALDLGEIGDDALEQEMAARESRVRNILFNAVKDELAEAGSREELLVGLLLRIRPDEHEGPR